MVSNTDDTNQKSKNKYFPENALTLNLVPAPEQGWKKPKKTAFSSTCRDAVFLVAKIFDICEIEHSNNTVTMSEKSKEEKLK